MNRDELDLISYIVESAYKNQDDYVNWTLVTICENAIKKEAENDSSGNSR